MAVTAHPAAQPGEQIFITTCAHNCGGRCVVRAHVQDGRLVRISTDNTPWNDEQPPLRACGRGFAGADRVNRSDRLLYPLVRSGPRGNGEFRRASWDEALELAASEIRRIVDTYGPTAIADLSRSGSTSMLHNRGAVGRLLNMLGGCTDLWGNLSNEAEIFAIKHTFGVGAEFKATGREGQDYLNSRLIVMWGWSPADGTFGTNTTQWLHRARQAGVRIVTINPRLSRSLKNLSDEHYFIRPATDTALALAIAYVILRDGLQDQAFLDRYTIGFDEAHLPDGAPAGASFREYVEGLSDGVPKTPAWAAPITGIPAERIEQLAREIGSTRPMALHAGYAPGRTFGGEQFHRAVFTLAAMTGNIGRPGGNSGSSGGAKFVRMGRLPTGKNPAGVQVNITQMADAILQGRAGGWPSDIKMVYSACGNLLNQIANVHRSVEAFMSLEFVLMHEQFITPMARYADVLLPATTGFERNDVHVPWTHSGHFAIYMQKAIEPMGETRNDLDICAALAERLGLEGFNPKTEDEWLREIVADSEIEDYDEFKAKGVARLAPPAHRIAFAEQVLDPERHPFNTPSGKIEIYSTWLGEHPDPYGLGWVPPVPTWVPPNEGLHEPHAARYPLQLCTPHSRARTHSIHANQEMLHKLDPQHVWINPADAAARGIHDGDPARIFNDRGVVEIPAHVTDAMAPGVVAFCEGAWFQPDERGVDIAGCPNTLSLNQPSASGSSTYNSCLVEVARA
ncbi:MAG: molybdopterin-dependent oxidoreductase [Chloroflexi bacterium]|nr:molybdopterin-dependent oxidoreductase [Chloroflexota bacterium]